MITKYIKMATKKSLYFVTPSSLKFQVVSHETKINMVLHLLFELSLLSCENVTAVWSTCQILCTCG